MSGTKNIRNNYQTGNEHKYSLIELFFHRVKVE
jgi:hypothetical protein